MTQTDGEIYHALRLKESILSKWVYYPKQSTDSMQSLLNYTWYFFNSCWCMAKPIQYCKVKKKIVKTNGIFSQN